MTDKKKKYLAPEMKVVEIEVADIIATSGPSVTINNGTGYSLEEENW